MNKLLQIKQELHQLLIAQLDEKIMAIQQAMFETSESMKNDTKSSAGDKFETGREMIQQELSNQQAQLEKHLSHKKDLSQINVQQAMEEVGFGSLINASNGNYFISVALGKIRYNETDYYALSLASPIGQVIKGSQKGDEISFQGRTIKILDLV